MPRQRISKPTFRTCVTYSLVAVCALLADAGRASSQVKVTLIDGKVIHSDSIGPKTNHVHLQLQIQSARIHMTRLIAWDRIVRTRIGGRDFTAAEVLASHAGMLTAPKQPLQLQRLVAMQSNDDINQKTEKNPEPANDKKADPFRLPLQVSPETPKTNNNTVEILAPPSEYDETFQEGASCVLPRSNRPNCRNECGVCQTDCRFNWGIGRLPVPRTVGLPIEYVDVGIQDDPLDAYADLLKKYYPNGVPLYESGFALSLMRAARADQIFRGFDKPAENLPPRPPAPDRLHNVPQSDDRVQRIEVTARPISARGKTDWDSLEVIIVALNKSGQPTGIRGTVYLNLTGQKQELIHSLGNEFVARRGAIKRIAQWSRFVDSTDDVRPTRLVVSFPQPIPDHDTRIAAFGELHVKLVAPGDGVFETTQRDVVLRRVSGLRNQQLSGTGSRFFAHEGTSGSRRKSGYHFRGTTSLRPRGGVFTVKP